MGNLKEGEPGRDRERLVEMSKRMPDTPKAKMWAAILDRKILFSHILRSLTGMTNSLFSNFISAGMAMFSALLLFTKGDRPLRLPAKHVLASES